jgi:hypothetical protein
MILDRIGTLDLLRPRFGWGVEGAWKSSESCAWAVFCFKSLNENMKSINHADSVMFDAVLSVK